MAGAGAVGGAVGGGEGGGRRSPGCGACCCRAPPPPGNRWWERPSWHQISQFLLTPLLEYQPCNNCQFIFDVIFYVHKHLDLYTALDHRMSCFMKAMNQQLSDFNLQSVFLQGVFFQSAFFQGVFFQSVSSKLCGFIKVLQLVLLSMSI